MLHITSFAPDCNPRATQEPEIGDVAELPPALDPARYPIIAEHFYGWRPVGMVAAQIVQALSPPAPFHEVGQ